MCAACVASVTDRRRSSFCPCLNDRAMLCVFFFFFRFTGCDFASALGYLGEGRHRQAQHPAEQTGQSSWAVGNGEVRVTCCRCHHLRRPVNPSQRKRRPVTIRPNYFVQGLTKTRRVFDTSRWEVLYFSDQQVAVPAIGKYRENGSQFLKCF